MTRNVTYVERRMENLSGNLKKKERKSYTNNEKNENCVCVDVGVYVHV